MKRALLYIDILGFESLVENDDVKVKHIFRILDNLKSHQQNHFFKLQTVVFSDTILIFNSSDTKNEQIHYYVTFLIEYAQEIFYKLAGINVYFRGVLTYGEFTFNQLKNIQSYYGAALIDAYNAEKDLDGFGLYVDKELSNEVIVFDKVDLSNKFDFILLCQSIKNLYIRTAGELPVEIDFLTDTDEFYRIDEDLRFFRKIEYLMANHPSEKVREKYLMVYDIYCKELPLFFSEFKLKGFMPTTICEEYTGNINPFELISKNELGLE